ncbi:MAG: alpha/beta hydrolase [Anaeroplasma sp.]
MIKKNINGYKLNIILPDNYNLKDKYKLLILNDGNMLENRLHLKFSGIIIGVIPNDRLNEYTPWYAPAIKQNSSDFKGKADSYNNFLIKEILPYIINNYNVDLNYIIYGGYSLGGLCAIKSLYTSYIFTHIFSICGSFWFPNFKEYVLSNDILNIKANVYLLNGLNEGKHHNNILNQAPVCANIIHKEISKSNKTVSIFDEYDHHQIVNDRFNKIIKLIDINKDL